MRNQPPGFRWLVGGFALLAGVAFGLRFLDGGDRPSLVFALICLVVAGYWLIFDREPDPEASAPDRHRGDSEWDDGING